MTDAQAPEVRQALGRTLAAIPEQQPGAGRTILDVIGRHDRKARSAGMDLRVAFREPAAVEELPAYLKGLRAEPVAFVPPPEVLEPEPQPEVEPAAEPAAVAPVVDVEPEPPAPTVSQIAAPAAAPTSMGDLIAKLKAMEGGPR